MPAADLLDPPQDRAVVAGSTGVVSTGCILGREVIIAADTPVPVRALDHLLRQMDDQWDVRRRRSDLSRVSNRPSVMVQVSPLTLLLVRDSLAAIRVRRRARAEPGCCQAVLDLRHGSVGLDVLAAAVASRLAPAVAVDVLTDFCLSSGARVGYVRVGDLVREFQDHVPAWLQQVIRDCGGDPTGLPDGRVDRSA